MTSLDMNGFWVFPFPATKADEAALQKPEAKWAWPGCRPAGEIGIIALPDGLFPRARAGRASYLAESSILGHKDPGAEAVARVFAELATREAATERDLKAAHSTTFSKDIHTDSQLHPAVHARRPSSDAYVTRWC
jgi:hypothetical protein